VWPAVLRRMVEIVQSMRGAAESDCHRRLDRLLLEPLLDLCSTLCLLCGEFMAARLQDELWPGVISVLILQCVVPTSRESSIADRTPNRAPSIVAPLSSVDSKIMLAMLKFINAACDSSSATGFGRRFALPITWALLSFLGASQRDSIRNAAEAVLSTLATHHRSQVGPLLRCVVDGDHRTWHCFCSSPSILSAFSWPSRGNTDRPVDSPSGPLCTPASDAMMSSLIADGDTVLRLSMTLASFQSSSEWATDLAIWGQAV
jgi:hypothetical protein